MGERADSSSRLLADEQATGSHGVPVAVRRPDVLRARETVGRSGPHPDAARFSGRLARAVADAPVASGAVGELRGVGAPREAGDAAVRGAAPGSVLERTGDPVPSALRDAVRRVRASRGAHPVVLPAEPALVCDRGGRIVQVNAALLWLVGSRLDEHGAGGASAGPLGMRLSEVVVGPDTAARLLRADGSSVEVRVVRREPTDAGLSIVVLVEPAATDPDRAGDAIPTAAFERLAGVGTWTFELATGVLRRSRALAELYRVAGVEAAGPGSTAVENEQVALLCQALRSGTRPLEHHVELRSPAGRLLSCHAEVQRAGGGAPIRLVGVVRDLGGRPGPQADDPARRRTEHAGQRFTDLMALAPGGVALLDGKGRVIDANPALCQLLGIPLERLRGTAARSLTVTEVPTPVGSDGLPRWLRPTEQGCRVEPLPLRRVDGTTVWCELQVSRTPADDGAPLWLVACSDVTEQRRAAELLRSAATVDELTRLPNRAASLALVDRLLAGPGRDRVAVVCGDLDDFARVNSSLGHEAGDDLLVTLAGRLQRELPVGCTAARLSGDEFVVICADHGEVGGPDLLARTVADLLRTTIPVHGRPVQVTASVGLAMPVPTGDVRAADLLRFAEAAMHDGKRRQSREGIGIATDGVVSSATQALELEAELRATIAGGGLALVYQPVVGPDGAVGSVEALVRWPHAERGLISPAEFLPVAQRSGLLRELDLWVLRTAACEAATWPATGGSRPAVAVNLAGLLPGDVDFLAAVTDIVEESGLAWDGLVLELVETSLVALPPHALAAMAELAERGVRFAVDDFGTGYSSLARLKELPAQTIKIDRAFVAGVGSDPADLAVARAVVDMAQAMGRTTVAEGVETAEQFHVLRDVGVDAFQGWLFARPLPPHELHDVLVRGRVDTPAAQEVGLQQITPVALVGPGG